MEKVLFLDLEIDGQKGRLLEKGYILGQEEMGKATRYQLRSAMRRAEVICGHNIVQHDMAFLLEDPYFQEFKDMPLLDTLYWSPLLRPSLKTHALQKDYLRVTHKNDALEDARQARNLLLELIGKFEAMPPEWQRILQILLKYTPGFPPLFELARPDYPSWVDIKETIAARMKNTICLTKLNNRFRQQHGPEIAYVLMLILAGARGIQTPSWVIGAFPKVQTVFDLLRNTPCGREDCPYCTQELNATIGLQNFFQFPGFRSFEGDGEVPLQQQTVEAALRNESLIAVFPTGGGKSLTFQLPALMRGRTSGSLTVVISPLISLMNDQIDNLREKSIVQAVALNSSLSTLERNEAIKKVQEGRAHIIYLSPEALRSNTIEKLLLGRIIDRFVIDEAHCFSTWGQDFRPDYLYIGKFIQRIQRKKLNPEPIPVSCFTATARREVIKDIREYFERYTQLPMQEFITLQRRTNLEFRAVQVKDDADKLLRLLDLLREADPPSIVYVSRRRRAEEVSGYLEDRGLNARPYHAGMEDKARKETQEQFKADEIDTIVATSAFGMGVDKDNVGLVVHYNVSNSLENYLQEAGRAGRNPDMQARCIVLFKEDDLDKHFNLLINGRLSKSEINAMWRGIKKFQRKHLVKSDRELSRAAEWDGSDYTNRTKVLTSLNVLEENEYVLRKNNATRVFATSLKPRNLEAAKRIFQTESHRFSPREQDHAIRILASLYSHRNTEVGYLADILEIPQGQVQTVIQIFRDIKILTDENDLSAAIALAPQHHLYFRKVHEKFRTLEPAFWDIILPPAGNKNRIDLRQINDRLDRDHITSSVADLRRLLEYWSERGLIHIDRVPADKFQYKISFRKKSKGIEAGIEFRHDLCASILDYLAGLETQRTEDKRQLVKFSLVQLKKDIAQTYPEEQKVSIRACEICLLYLHAIEALELRDGYLVYYMRIALERLEEDNRKQYTELNHKKLSDHYKHQGQQIHIVGDYVKKLLESPALAEQFARDYFELTNEDFLRKYYNRRERKTLARTMTESRYQELTKELSPAQQRPFDDTEAQQIIIAAGPGSGKTRTLVRKMASLLLLEGVKTSEFLMLTFSRPAAQEFKERLHQLAPGLAYQVDIYTFHGFAFRLLGQLGNLEKADSVIAQATQAIREGLVPLDEVSAKTVLVLDEFQDVSQQEYDLIQAIRKAAEGLKIIAAGDDDQNIYEFRGASSRFMRDMSTWKDSQLYFLTENYRSRPNLIHFTNQWVRKLGGERLKKTKELKPAASQGGPLNFAAAGPGVLNLFRYEGGHLLPCFVERLQTFLKEKPSTEATTAVLVATNEEAAMVCHALRASGIPAQLVANTVGFRLQNLKELRHFSNRLHQSADPGTGRIDPEDWKGWIKELELKFEKSTDLPFVLRAIEAFKEEHENLYWLVWQNYIRELRTEDFFFPDRDRIMVSTMHKSKGKEFDQVFILLDGYSIVEEEAKRTVYVAMTRAKSHLEIHTNAPVFDYFKAEGLIRRSRKGAALPLQEIRWPGTLKDVVLGDFQKGWIAERVNELVTGEQLHWFDDERGYRWLKGPRGKVGRLSRKMLEELGGWKAKGYELASVEVDHLAWWWDKNTDQECLVLIPSLLLRRPESQT